MKNRFISSIYSLFSIKKIAIPQVLKDFYKTFEENGFQAYLVGGAVRDIFLGKPASDWDVATNATPQDVMRIFKFVVPTGIEHGTVTVHFKSGKTGERKTGEVKADEGKPGDGNRKKVEKVEIEVTTFRTESGYSDGRHPDSVNYAATIEEDLSRRDFTMNAIAVDLKDGRIVDPFGGRKDIRKKTIRTVGDAGLRFMEDGLRPVRAVRFAAQLGFSIEKSTYSGMFKDDILKKVSSISAERFRDELMKMMKAPKPSIGLKMMEETGIMKIFMPELLEGRGCTQKDDRGYHVFDVLDHNYYACDGAPASKPLVRLAALLHDSGKPASRTERHEEGLLIYNFYNHERESSKIAREIMTRLKFSNAETDHVCLLIENHMFNYTPDWSDGAVRRLLVKVGAENMEDLIDIRLADMYGKYNAPPRLHDSPACNLLIELQDRSKEILEKKNALSLKDLAVNGKDLMAAGIPAGKEIGRILNELLNSVLEDPALNDKERLMEIVKKMVI